MQASSLSPSLDLVCNLHRFSNTRHAKRVQRKQHPVPGQRNPRIIGYHNGIGLPVGGGRIQGDTTLVGVDCVGGASHSNQGKRLDSGTGGDCESATDFDAAAADAVDGGPSCTSTCGGEKVGGREELCIVVICRAGTAETTASVYDGTVHHEKSGGMVVPGHRNRVHLGEFLGRRIP